jgi:hypothetical protein
MKKCSLLRLQPGRIDLNILYIVLYIDFYSSTAEFTTIRFFKKTNTSVETQR